MLISVRSTVRRTLAVAALVTSVAPLAQAQEPTATSPAAPPSNGGKLPPVRLLGPVTARSTETLGSIGTAVPLPGGKVLVNDILNRRVVMFDSTLANVTVVADTTSATANAYGARGGGLIGYGGDSALFIDPASLSMMVVNPNGELTTVRAVPRANEINLLSGGPNGRPGFDPQGRLVYRGLARARQGGGPGGARQGGGQGGAQGGARQQRGGGGGGGGGGTAFGGGPGGFSFQLPEQPDSAPIVRVDLASRALDTLATFKIPKIDIKATQTADGRPNIITTVNPMPNTDDWALLSDGTIALVRGHDFHVDWRKPDGTIVSSPKLPFEWQRMNDEEKQAVIDSSRAAMERQREEAQRMMQASGGPMAFINGGGAERMTIMMGPGGGGAPPARGAAPAAGAVAGGAAAGGGAGGGAGNQGGGRGAQGGGPGGPGGATFQIPPVNMIPATELPDYRPPFAQQASLGDLDGLLWVRTTAPQGEHGPIYYVISPATNEVVDRVQLPQGRMISGFGKGGVVYMSFRDLEGKVRLEVSRLR